MKQSCREIQAYLYEQIPLSKAMEVRVVEVNKNSAILTAPLQLNRRKPHNT